METESKTQFKELAMFEHKITLQQKDIEKMGEFWRKLNLHQEIHFSDLRSLVKKQLYIVLSYQKFAVLNKCHTVKLILQLPKYSADDFHWYLSKIERR